MPERSPGRCAWGRTRQLSRELLPAATRRENQELKTDAPSGHGLAAALGIQTSTIAMPQYLRNDAVRLFEASMETLQLAIVGLGLPYPHGLRQDFARYAPVIGFVCASRGAGHREIDL